MMDAPLTVMEAAPAAAGAPVTVPGAVNPLDLPAEIFRAGLDRRRANRSALMDWIRASLVEGVDYGVIQTRRGPSKPSLWKPGSEKICGMLGLTAHFPTLRDYEQAILSGVALEHIILRCELRDSAGRIVAEGVGARSLRQDSGDLNKALKMAEKSAMIDATLRCAGLSEVFTQDLEDMAVEPEPARAPGATGRREPPGAPGAALDGTSRLTDAQVEMIEHRIRTFGLDRDRVLAWIKRAWGVERIEELPISKFTPLVDRLFIWREQMRERAAATAAAGEESAETTTESEE